VADVATAIASVSPSIPPPYLRRSKSIETLLPILYLKGISTGDFSEALATLLGKDAVGLSASAIGHPSIASKAGRTTDVTTITCCTKFNERRISDGEDGGNHRHCRPENSSPQSVSKIVPGGKSCTRKCANNGDTIKA
jgi:hypothetical protein